MAEKNPTCNRIECPNCEYTWEEKPPSSDIVQMTDLREISEGSRYCETKVYLTEDNIVQESDLWLRFGAARVRKLSNLTDKPEWVVDCKLAHGTTDSEHDRALAVSLPVVCLELETIFNHNVYLQGFVDPRNKRSFHVPRPGYNPILHRDTYICQDEICPERSNGAHPIVPDDFYLPPYDHELFEAVKMRPIRICLLTLKEL